MLILPSPPDLSFPVIVPVQRDCTPFEFRQAGIRLQVIDLLLSLVERFRPPVKDVVVDETHTTERPRQKNLLFMRRLAAVFVGAFHIVHSSQFNTKTGKPFNPRPEGRGFEVFR